MLINSKIPSYLLEKYQLIGTVVFSIMFAVIFLNLYIPFSETAWFALGDSSAFLNTIFFISVSIFILIASRMAMYYTSKHKDITYLGYVMWCIMEIAVVCYIYTQMTMLVHSEAFPTEFAVFKHAFPYCAIALGVPYFMSAMYFAIIDKDKTIQLMNYENIVTDEVPANGEQLKKITLFDNNGSLRMSVSLDNLYFIQSDDNYIKVWYTDNQGELQRYMLRCRLKTIEESFKGSGLIRCNRQYIVNMSKVCNMKKEGNIYILELDNQAISPIPVTKSHTAEVSKYFTESNIPIEQIND